MRRTWAVPAALTGAALTGAAVTAVVCAVPAAAAPPAEDVTSLQAPPALSWITLTDSKGISIWLYELSLDRGGLTNPAKFFWSSITETAWGAYRAVCALALWFLDWVLGFGWVQVVAAPLMAVGDAIRDVVGRLGLVPTLLTVTAFAAGGWLLRGRRMTALWEVGVACLIATLASGVLANPVALVAGPNGYVVRANQVGQELAVALATGDGEGRTPEQLRADQTQALVDTFLRQPTQMINFGAVLDGGDCEAAFDDVVRAGPYNDRSDVRDAVGDCDERYGQFAASPNASMALGSLLFLPAGLVILGLAVVVAGSVVMAGCWAMFQSLKAVVVLITGILPGGMRGSLLLTLAETTVSLLILVFTSVFLGVFLLVIQSVFANSADEGLARTFVITDVLLVVGLVVYLRAKGRIRKGSARLAQLLSRRPGGAPPTALPGVSAGPGRAGAMARAAASGFVGAQVHGRGRGSGARSGVRGAATAGVKTATTAAAAAVSGGTSAAVTTAVRAGRTVSSSRRAVVLARMATSHARDRQGDTAGPPAGQGAPGRPRRRGTASELRPTADPTQTRGSRVGGKTPESDPAGLGAGGGSADRWAAPISRRPAAGGRVQPGADAVTRPRPARQVYPVGGRATGPGRTGQTRRRVKLQVRLAGAATPADHGQPVQPAPSPAVPPGRASAVSPGRASAVSPGRPPAVPPSQLPADRSSRPVRQRPRPQPGQPTPQPREDRRPAQGDPPAAVVGAAARPRATGPRRRVSPNAKRSAPTPRPRATADV